MATPTDEPTRQMKLFALLATNAASAGATVLAYAYETEGYGLHPAAALALALLGVLGAMLATSKR